MTNDNDEKGSHTEPVLEMIKRLTLEAKKYKSFTLLFYLNSLIQFIDLWEKYWWNPKINQSMQKASCIIAVSVGKGLYMA
ncbi:hypothetical protein J3R82DRAFT_11644 [Butyriboletus roseoflavus]|nr:hypothetical protein J3R82DRAFT_11644 [Butyriboletus roseoflavus]